MLLLTVALVFAARRMIKTRSKPLILPWLLLCASPIAVGCLYSLIELSCFLYTIAQGWDDPGVVLAVPSELIVPIAVGLFCAVCLSGLGILMLFKFAHEAPADDAG